MADRERVAYDIERCISHVPDACRDCSHYWGKKDGDVTAIDCMEELMADALALLKEQEPVEPSVDVDTYVCPNCGHRLEHQGMLGDNVIFDEQYNFCPACGKAVKWE